MTCYKGLSRKKACILVQFGYNMLKKLRCYNTSSCQVLVGLYTGGQIIFKIFLLIIVASLLTREKAGLIKE